MQQHRRHKRDGSRTVNEANALFPVGSPVWFRPISGEPEEEATFVRSEAWAHGDGSVVLKVEGRAGGVSTDVAHLRTRSLTDRELEERRGAFLRRAASDLVGAAFGVHSQSERGVVLWKLATDTRAALEESERVLAKMDCTPVRT